MHLGKASKRPAEGSVAVYMTEADRAAAMLSLSVMRLCRITDSDSIAFALLRGGVGVSLHFEMYNISK